MLVNSCHVQCSCRLHYRSRLSWHYPCHSGESEQVDAYCVESSSDLLTSFGFYPTYAQYGSADSKVTYTHRLGRTGRAGRSGKGLVVLLPFETKLVGGMRRNGVEVGDIEDFDDTKEVVEMLSLVRNRIRSGNPKLTSSAEGAYRAFLAYYMSRADALSVSSVDIVHSANQFAESVGLVNLPSLSEKTATKLNLVGVKDISIDKDES